MRAILKMIGLLLVFCGCSGGKPSALRAGADHTARLVAGVRKATFPSGPIKSKLPAAEMPATPQAFQREFVRRFEQDPWAAFRDLTYWGSLPQDARRLDMEDTLKLIADLKIEEAKVRPVTSEDVDYDSPECPWKINLPPKYVLELETSKGTLTIYNYYPIGVKDGRLYFCCVTSK